MRANNSIFNGTALTVHGDNNTINGPNCTVYGDNNKVNGPHCYVHGDNNVIKGSYCNARGDNNKLIGTGCCATGMNNKIKKGDEFVSHNPMVNDDYLARAENLSDHSDGGVVVDMSSDGGMRIWKNGIEQQPFMVAKKDKKKKEKKEKKRPEPKEPVFIEGPTAADLAADKEAKDNEAQCIICLTNTPCCIANPCNHLSFCVACARTLCFASVKDERPKQVGELACPKCKAVVEKIKRVFE